MATPSAARDRGTGGRPAIGVTPVLSAALPPAGQATSHHGVMATPGGRPPVRRSFFPRRFPPTREGWFFLIGTFVIGLGAVNGGINLLFLVFGMMLGLIIASGVLSELCLRNLTVTRRPPATVHAGTPHLMSIAVRNDKRRVPTFSLEVEDLMEGRPVDRRCYFLKLPAGRTQETSYRHTLTRRGLHHLSGFRVSTRFPFGFIRKSRDLDAPAEILAYPALVPVDPILERTGLVEQGERARTSKSRAGEFHGLRAFRPGDDPRDIHWRTSARRGQPFVREAEDENGRTVLVALEDRSDADDEAFERAVSTAASLAVSLLRAGYHVGLRAGEDHLAPSADPRQATRALHVLALVQRDAAREAAGPAAPGPAPRPAPAARHDTIVIHVAPGAAPHVARPDRPRRSA